MRSRVVPQLCLPQHVPERLVFEFDYAMETTGVNDPFAVYSGLADRGAPELFYTPAYGGHWVARSYGAVQSIYLDHENFTSFPSGIPPFLEKPRKFIPVEIDPPDHGKYRRALAPLFGPVAVAAMEDRVRKLAVELIESFEANGRCDFHTQFAHRLPTLVFLEMMGMPLERGEEFIQWAHNMLGADLVKRMEAVQHIGGFIHQFVLEKQSAPGDDWASRLIECTDESGGPLFSQEELLDMNFFLFLGGLDTVLNTLTHSWRHFAKNPDLRAELIRFPDKIPAAVEELLRLHGVTNSVRRAKRDTEVLGVSIAEGEAVLIPASMANLDPNAFESPHTTDLDRKGKRHMSFGAGVHHCVGARLARLEIRVSIEEWLARIPDFRIVDEASISSVSGATLAITHLPLIWGK